MFEKQRVKSLLSIKPMASVGAGYVGRLHKMFLCLLPQLRAQVTSALSQDLLVCPSLPWPSLTSLAISASLRGITFLGHPLRVTVLTLHCSSFYNSSSNEHLHFTPSSVTPLFSTGWKPHNLQDNQHFNIETFNMLNQFRSRHLSSDAASISNVNKNS